MCRPLGVDGSCGRAGGSFLGARRVATAVCLIATTFIRGCAVAWKTALSSPGECGEPGSEETWTRVNGQVKRLLKCYKKWLLPSFSPDIRND